VKLNYVRDQDVFPAFDRITGDADQSQERRGCGCNKIGGSFAVLQKCRGRTGKAVEHRNGHPGGTARRINGEIRRFSQLENAPPVLAPLLQAFFPHIRLSGSILIDRLVEPRGVLGIDPGKKLGGAEIGKIEQQVAHVAFRIYHQRRDLVDSGFFQQSHAQTGLAAARHPYADAVGHKVFGIIKDQILGRFAGRRIVAPAQIELAKFFKVFHLSLSLTA
jgi:hypothetical protein